MGLGSLPSVGLLLSRGAPRGLLSGMRPSDNFLFDSAYLQAIACRDEGLGGLASISGLTLVGLGLPYMFFVFLWAPTAMPWFCLISGFAFVRASGLLQDCFLQRSGVLGLDHCDVAYLKTATGT